jgi:hypothetical protein
MRLGRPRAPGSDPPDRRAAPRVGVPGYFHPAVDPGSWARLADAVGRGLGPVILNPGTGPGLARDPEYATVVDRLGEAQLLGYVDAAYGHRTPAAVAQDALRYARWYGVRDVFLDQTRSDPNGVGYCRQLVAVLRAAGCRHVVLNPGTVPHAAYAQVADALVVFEGEWPAYRDIFLPDWTRRAAIPLWHLVYATPPERVMETVRRAARLGAAVSYVTEQSGANPWRALPATFDAQLAAARDGSRGPRRPIARR